MAEKLPSFLLLGYTHLILHIVCIITHPDDDVTPTQLCFSSHTYFLDAHLQPKHKPHSQGCSYTMQINANDISR
jgi:hypothetical protein